MKMKTSLLALQIALFHYPAADAFVQNNALARTRKPHHELHKQQRSCKKHVSSTSVLDSSMGSSASEIIEMLPVIQQRHPIFAKTNAVSKPMTVPHPELWRRCLPEKKMETQDEQDEKGGFWGFLSPQQPTQHIQEVPLKDMHVQFDNPATGARQLLEQCGIISSTAPRSSNNDPSSYTLPLPETIMTETETLQHLTDILAYFQSVAAGGGGSSCNNKQPKCIARVVSTLGSVGTKCPRWHADHVPVRLVMSIVGPGCEYIPETFGTTNPGDENDQSSPRVVVNRQALNNLDEEDTRKANDIIVPPDALLDAEKRYEETVIKNAKAGDAVLLMGRGWEDSDCATNTEKNVFASPDANKVLAAVHRSPILEPDQERILLTVDLVDW